MMRKRNKYDSQVSEIAQATPVSDIENRLTREMLNTAISIINYRMSEKYQGAGSVREDNFDKIKKSLSNLQSEIDIFTESFGIKDVIKEKSSKRVNRLWQKLKMKK